MKKITSLITTLALMAGSCFTFPISSHALSDPMTDSATPALAENLMFTSVKDGDGLTAARNFNNNNAKNRINAEINFALDTSDASHWEDAKTYASSVLEALQTINDPPGDGHAYYGTTGVYTAFNQGAFNPNKTYVFRAYVKAEGDVDAYFTNGIESGIYDTLVYSNEYGSTGKKIETGDYQEYATTITLPSTYDTTGNNWFLSILPDGVKKGAKVRFRTEHADDIYLAEEQAYSLSVTSDSKTLRGSGAVNVTAETLNQVGLKGKLDQNVTWYALTADRQAVVPGITVTPGADSSKAVVTADSTVEDGTYTIVASSDRYGLVKGCDIVVKQGLPNLTDTAPVAAPENLIPKSDDELQSRPRWIRSNAGRNSTNIQQIADVNQWNTEKGAATNCVIYVDEGQTTAPSTALGYDGIVIKTGLEFKAGKTYCVSARAKLADKSLKKADGTEIQYPSGENRANLGIAITNEKYGSTSYTKEYGVNGAELGDEYTDFKGTIKLNDSYDNNGPHEVVIGYPAGYTQGSAIMIDTSKQDSIYVAEEKAVKIANTIVSGDSKLACGSSVTIKAEVQNQLGIPGNLDQSVEWHVLNTDRTKEIEDITIVKENGCARVTIGSNVPEGEYDIVAVSDNYNIVKGITITVSDFVEKISSLELKQEYGYANLAASVANCSSETVVFILAAYDEGKLVDIILDTQTVTGGVAKTDITFEEPLENGNVVKAFVWNGVGAGSMKSIANVSGFNTTMTIDSAE